MSFDTIRIHSQGSGRDLPSLRSVDHELHRKKQIFLFRKKWGVGGWDE